MSFLRIVPKHIINPKKVNYCLDCSNIYDTQCQKCYSCDTRLETLNYISYVANFLRIPTIDVCPLCNSVDIMKSSQSFGKYELERETVYKCDKCVNKFKIPKSVNRNDWVKTNCPELKHEEPIQKKLSLVLYNAFIRCSYSSHS